ncbi:hypothetical protein [Curtobacterium sp. 9128]|uniref:hypothetical protein n=1 Tax=Curtobacterium sp. 9128 TaxID=1793722 RepID=UPI00119DD821|nr:hypothetical protein [Curtobacterium sp. 9128]
MSGTLVVLDAHPRPERYEWLVTEQYCRALLHVDSWGAALGAFTPLPDVLLVAGVPASDGAGIASIVRVSRSLGVRVVCDGSSAPEVLPAAVAAGATGWDGGRDSAPAVFGAA